jgi:dTDP-4-amino-4,6-dideoxygalactose transaminase
MNIPFVDLKSQFHQIRDEILDELEEVCESSNFVLGPFVKKFEDNFSQYIGSKFCVALNTGTAADQLAIQALIQSGDEVITTPNTFIATSEAITTAGGKVKFVDIEQDSYNLDPTKLESVITKNTKVIVPVHLYGQPVDMDPIIEIARALNLSVVEDAAQAHGAEYKGKKAGTLGDAAAFSFYPGKNLGAYGEGGAVTTDSDKIAEFVRMYRDHGSKEKYIHEFEGHNMRMEGFQGAVLNVKLKYLDDWIKNRQKNARLYNQLFQDVEGIVVPREMPYAKHVYHLYVIRVKEREKLRHYLNENGIASGFHYKYPLHLQKAYQHLGHKKGDFPVTEKVMKEIISLPMYPELTKEQIEYVAHHVIKFVKNNR